MRQLSDVDEQNVRLLVVPYVPFRCPHCGRHKPRTHAVRGRHRWHKCLACGESYKSIELDARRVLDGWRDDAPRP